VGEQVDGEQQGDGCPAGDQDRLPAQGGCGGDVGGQRDGDAEAEGGPQGAAVASPVGPADVLGFVTA